MGMFFLKLMPEVKVNVRVIRKQYVTLCNDLVTYLTLKNTKHTKFGIPTHKILGLCSRNNISRTEVRGQSHSGLKTSSNTLQPQDVSTHRIWELCLKKYKRYAPDTIFLELKAEVKAKDTVPPLPPISLNYKSNMGFLPQIIYS